MRHIEMVVGNKPVGTALTFAYPNGKSHGIFIIPIYSLTVSGKDTKGEAQKREFEVFRFGVQGKTATSPPRIVASPNISRM